MTAEHATARGSTFSARWRIVAWLLVTTTLGLAAVVLTMNSTLRADVARQANEDVAQELAEFRDFERRLEPGSGEGFATAEQLVEAFLSRQRPVLGEYLVAILPDGSLVESYGPGTSAAQEWGLPTDEAAREAVESEPSGVIDTPAGTARWGAAQLTGADGEEAGRFVAVNFTEPAEEGVERTITLLAGVAGGVLLVVSLVGWVVAGQILRPVRTMRRSAREITEKDPSQRLPVEGRDDIAELGHTFNTLLDRLDRALTTEQRFVEGAGFELRRPVERVREALSAMVGPERHHREAERVVRSELDAFERRLSELRFLARAERPDFLSPGPVTSHELAGLVEAELLAITGTTWRRTSVHDVEAVADPDRLLTAVRQLAENAADHAPDGSPVTWAIEAVDLDGRAHLQVSITDTGPGISQEQAEHLFDRFALGEPGADPRLGLGLAVVRAVADAHGGTAGVDSRPGAGSTFFIAVPLDGPEPQP